MFCVGRIRKSIAPPTPEGSFIATPSIKMRVYSPPAPCRNRLRFSPGAPMELFTRIPACSCRIWDMLAEGVLDLPAGNDGDRPDCLFQRDRKFSRSHNDFFQLNRILQCTLLLGVTGKSVE